MKTLILYLRPYRGLVILVLILAAMNIGFSLVDPIIFGKLINLASFHQKNKVGLDWNTFLFTRHTINITKTGKPEILYGVMWLLLASITVAMISRIAKNFQDYFLNVIVQKFGA